MFLGGTGRKTIYYKKAVVDFADEIGVDIFFSRSNQYLAKSPAELRKWDKELKELILPNSRMRLIDSIAWFNSYEGRLREVFTLIRKNKLYQPSCRAWLSNAEKPIFDKLLKGEKLLTKEANILISENILTRDKKLTAHGELHLLSRKSLAIQLSTVPVEVRSVPVSWAGPRPELRVMQHLEKTTDMRWLWLENELHSMFSGYFYQPLYKTLGISGHGDSVAKNLEDSLKELFTLQYFNSTIDKLDEAFLNPVWLNCFSVPSAEDAALIFRALGYDFCRDLFLDDHDTPGVRHMGWPDLIGVKKDTIQFVEVKRGDKLTFGQLRNFPFILERGVPLYIAKIHNGQDSEAFN
jgi:hypothetical protein